MLYDPKWEEKTKVAPSVTGLIAWLETQKPGAEYPYWNCEGRCLIGLYFNSIGLLWADGYNDPGQEYFNALPSCHPLLMISCGLPYTFGAALERARELSA